MDIRKPVRASRSYTQHLAAPPSEVFPLLCPVREQDWIDGWDPTWVATASGVGEPGCVFVTRAEPHDAVWVITRHESETGRIEMLKVTPEVTACVLSIRLEPSSEGSLAHITYSHTSLGPQGDEFVASFTEEYYEAFMREWETRLNHYLQTGKKLVD